MVTPWLHPDVRQLHVHHLATQPPFSTDHAAILFLRINLFVFSQSLPLPLLLILVFSYLPQQPSTNHIQPSPGHHPPVTIATIPAAPAGVEQPHEASDLRRSAARGEAQEAGLRTATAQRSPSAQHGARGRGEGTVG